MRTEFALAILLALAFGVISTTDQRRRANLPPRIDSFTSSLKTVQICPFVPAFDKPEVTLVVNAIDPDGDALLYEYSTADGTISGEGKSVVWDLHGLPRGPHEARVTVQDGYGGKAEASLTVVTADALVCDPPPPRCPVIKVSCSDEMDQSKTFRFSAVVEGDATAHPPPSFHWKINAGKLIKGQNSREIEVSTAGANGFESITATVDVSGFDPSCAGTIASCTTKIITH